MKNEHLGCTEVRTLAKGFGTKQEKHLKEVQKYVSGILRAGQLESRLQAERYLQQQAAAECEKREGKAIVLRIAIISKIMQKKNTQKHEINKYSNSFVTGLHSVVVFP